MIKKLILIIILLPLFLMLFAKDVEAAYNGLIIAESKEVEQGEHFSIELSLINNDIDISGLFMPLRYSSSDLIFDSVSFEGAIITDNFNGAVFSDPIENYIQISYFPNIQGDTLFSIPSPNGIVATLFFTVSNSAPPGFIFLDSVNEITTIGTVIKETNINLTPDGVSTYYPGFGEGIVTVMVPTAIEENVQPGLPIDFTLSQNYPNPFNPSTNISFALPEASMVKLDVYNVLGQLVKTLVNRRLPAGYHSVDFDASDQSSGVFFYRMEYEQGTVTKKMMLIK